MLPSVTMAKSRLSRVLTLAFGAALACAGEGPSAGAQGQVRPPTSVTGVAPGAPSLSGGPTTPRPPATTSSPSALSPAMARPLFLGVPGPAGEAAARFALGDQAGARDGFARALAAAPDDATKNRLALLVAVCDAAMGRHAQAATAFEDAIAGVPVLADYAAYSAARSYALSGDRAAARKLAAGVPADSIWDAERRLLLGDLLRADASWKDALAHYQRYLEDLPNGMRRAEARYRVGEAEEHLRRTAAAVETYRQLAIDAPGDPWGREALQRIEAIAPWPKGAAKRVKGRAVKKGDLVARPKTAAEFIRRGMAHFDSMRNVDSEDDFTAALSAPGLTPADACIARYHQAQSVFKQRQRARSGPLFDDAAAACAKAGNTDLQVRALYQAGRGWNNGATRDARLKAIARFEQAEGIAAADHSYADDARLRRAETWDELAKMNEPGAADKATALYAELPAKHPGGDMAAESLWRLAWREYKLGHYLPALAWLDQLIAVVPHDDNYYAEGQAMYWRARTLGRMGRAKDALAAYELTVREYPLSYYSLLALNRLRELDPRAPARVLGDANRLAPSVELRFRDRPVYGAPGFARALEFLRLGLGVEAERELARVGLRAPGGKSKVTDPDRLEELWAIALLYDAGGRIDKSHWIGRWAALDYRRYWPTPTARRRWDLAYPKGWWHLLEPAAKAQGYPPELLISFVREESAFTPTLESFANAIGLTQMILPTAKRFGGGLGFAVTPAALREPDKNVAIGSRFLGFLVNTFGGRIALVVPSYNAGEGATFKWLCERPTQAQDEWGEDIPYDETRNYTKRVIGTYFTYAYLNSGTIPEMPNVLPPAVVAARKCP